MMTHKGSWSAGSDTPEHEAMTPQQVPGTIMIIPATSFHLPVLAEGQCC